MLFFRNGQPPYHGVATSSSFRVGTSSSFPVAGFISCRHMALTLPRAAVDLWAAPTMLRFQRVALLLPVAALLLLGSAGDRLPTAHAAPAPRLTLWAWQRPEDLPIRI